MFRYHTGHDEKMAVVHGAESGERLRASSTCTRPHKRQDTPSSRRLFRLFVFEH